MNATGWAKIGFILLTLPDELEAINSRLDDIVKRLFYGRDRGHLPVEVIEEDLAVSPGHNGKYLGDTGQLGWVATERLVHSARTDLQGDKREGTLVPQ